MLANDFDFDPRGSFARFSSERGEDTRRFRTR
jgi:hypothetical protein